MNDRKLNSWKEIAAHLGIDERSSQRWEKKYGLPVHRLEESPKSRVFAYTDELDGWLDKATKNKILAANHRPGVDTPEAAAGSNGADKPTAPRRRIFVAGGVFIAIAAILLFIHKRPWMDRRPADFWIDGSALVVTNKSGRDLWRYDTGKDGLYESAAYRKYFQVKRLDDGGPVTTRNLPRLIIRDLNRDGRNEVLFAPIYQDEMDSGKIVYLDRKGGLIWDFETGTEVRVGEKSFPADFRIDGFDVIDLDEDGVFEILIISHAKEQYPTRVLILDQSPRTRGEYWHAGQLSDYVLRDFDRDGRPELLLSGQNNEYEKPCLVMLDPLRMTGGSPQGSDFRFADKGRGQELLYALLPLSPVEALARPGIGITRFDIMGAERIRASVNVDAVYYEFDFSLRPLTVELSHVFERLYQEAFRGGRIRTPLDRPETDRIRRSLLDGILWYDGKTKSWSKAWAMANPR
jgi:hypothetical protein